MSQTLACLLCGMEFQKTETVCVAGCPVKGACTYVRCPYCHYEMPETPRFLDRLRALWSRPASAREGAAATNGALTLDRLRAGESATVTSVGCTATARRNSLGVFGVAPGAEVTLLQRYPACVVRVGETELGLDEAIAREIEVERGET